MEPLDADSVNKLVTLLEKVQEGFRPLPYKDTEGHQTIGIGWNLDATPMTLQQARYVCSSQIYGIDQQLNSQLDCYAALTPVRKTVLINMAFQMGVAGLMGFFKFLKYVSNGLYVAASNEMLNSDWAHNFSKRAMVLSQAMSSGNWPKV